MKRKVIIICALMASLYIYAGKRTAADALCIADEFLSYSVSGPTAQRSYSASGLTAKRSVITETDTYLAVNTSDGFVLVGADDRLPEVLGYSDSGTFDPDNMSPSMRYFLQCYAEELDQIENHKSPRLCRSTEITNHKSQQSIAAIAPLCTSKWNQGEPYNNYAPTYNDYGSRCVTGCVATAMAQVMYFHRHPAKGMGSHSYLWVCTNPLGKTATLSANFGSTTYRWSDMIDSYRNGYTSEQADAVATLMYHCGVSIEMGYGQSSGAFTEKVPVALNSYFGYDANYQKIQKVMYPADSLNAIIASELSSQRPVIVSGHNDEGGHAFVCDGCDNKGYFHINWGWGGSNDGYFLLTALNPRGSQGIGGTTQGYNKGTAFFIGLQPAKSGTPKAIPQMATTNISVSKTSFSRSAKFDVSILRLENFGMTDFSGSYGVALYDEDETKLVRVLKQVDNYSLRAGYHRTTEATLSDLTIPAASVVPDGTYHLCAVYKDANYGWMKLLCTEDDYFRTLTIANNTVTFYANDAEAELTLTQALAFPEGTDPNAVPKSGIPVSFAVKNNGGTFRGQISARIYQGNFARGQYEIVDSLVIRRNQTLSTALQEAFDSNLKLETQYKMRICWRADENDSWHNFEGAEDLLFKLYDPEFHISLTDTIRFDNNDSVPRDNANLYYEIKNTGAPFDGELQVSFYQNNFSRGKSSIKEVYVGTNETVAGSFSGALEQAAGTYTVILRYREKEGDWKEFFDIYERPDVCTITATIVEPTPPTPPGPPTDLEQIVNRKSSNRKFIKDGQLLILRDGKIYNAQGQLIE